MTNSQELHLLEIKEKFRQIVDRKYRAGAKEHGGNLEDMPELDLIENALFEAVDQFTYLLTLYNKKRGTR